MTKSTVRAILAAAALTGALFVPVRAEDPPGRTRRFELSGVYEALSPSALYHSWKNFLASYYSGPATGLTWFFQLGGFTRPEGQAALGVAGAYKDWGPGIYTYTALAVGSRSGYLPSFRFDHDTNFKFGAKRNIVWTIGLTYIRYFDVHRTAILSTGLTLYLEGWILTYRIFGNQSDPGHIQSASHLVDAALGREGSAWTNLTLSFGKQAYLATNLARPEEINKGSLSITLKHKRWMGKKGFGLLGEAGYFRLSEGYDKYTISAGFFKEF
jgi:YaiO family outer membrane protein